MPQGRTRLTLQAINGLRDAAQHYLLYLSEQQLYIFCQAGVTLFGDLLRTVFDESLASFLPPRVMPVSTDPPKDIDVLVDDEFAQIRGLLDPRRRRFHEAKGRLRPIAIMEACLAGSDRQPSDRSLESRLRELKQGTAWQQLFPGVAGLAFEVDGNGPTYNLRLTKKEGTPVQLVGEGEGTAAVIAVKAVNELSFYSLAFNDLAEKLRDAVGRNKLIAVIRHLGLQEQSDYFREISVGKMRFKRYSSKALDLLHKTLPTLDVESIWRDYRAEQRGRDS